jgi:hypothetical protein
MTKIINYTMGCLMLLSLLVSCEETPYNPKEFLPAAKGDMGEVVVVIDKNYWQGPVMIKLKEIFEKEVMSLPQPEPLMQMSIITMQGFGKGTNQHHSVLIIEIDDSPANKNAYISERKEDMYAIGQVIYTLRAPNQAAAVELLEQGGEFLLSEYQKQTSDVLAKKFKGMRSAKINEEMGITLGVNMDIPSNFIVAANYNDFMWMKQMRQRYSEGKDHEIQIGIMVYTYPYTDSLAFSMDKVLEKRDAMTQKYVSGMIEGSYMKTERTYGLESSEKMIGDKYVMETRGVWKMENAFMGGPFISLTTYDEKRERIVVLDGYVYAPHFRKMEYLREVEAILYSFNFNE